MLVPNSSLEKIFNHAVDTAKKYQHEYVTIEHMLFAMLHDDQFNEFLQDYGIKVEDMGKDLARYLETQLDSIKTKQKNFTPRKTSSLERVFNRCFTSVLFLGKDEIEPVDIFISMFTEDKSFVAWLMKKYKIDKKTVSDYINQSQVMGDGATTSRIDDGQANKILRRSGVAFISVKNSDKKYLDKFVPGITNAGFKVVATSGTADYIEGLGFSVERVNKVTEGRPHIVDNLLNNEIDLVINTTEGTQSIKDSASIRQSALRNKIFCTTTMFGAFAIIDALKSNEENWTYSTLQEINK